MATMAVVGNSGSKRAVGSLPRFVEMGAGKVASTSTGDTFVRTSPAVRQPEDSSSDVSHKTADTGASVASTQKAAAKGPTTEAGKIAETAYAGALGVGAGAGGFFLGKSMMSMVEQMGPLSLENLGKQFGVAGVGVGIPFALVQDSFGYKDGQISAKRYWGNVASDALGWGAWGAGALLVGGALGGVGFIPVAAGLLAGGVLNSISDHTIGRWVSNTIADHLPAKAAKAGADAVVKYITNPLDKYVLGPIKRHLGVFLATGGAAALYFGIEGDGKMALKGLGAMGATMPGQMLTDNVLGKVAPLAAVKGVDLVPGKGQVYQNSDGTVVSKASADGSQSKN